MPDEVLEELWEIKDNMAREHDNDVRKLADYLQSKTGAKLARTNDLGTMNGLSEADNSINSASERFL